MFWLALAILAAAVVVAATVGGRAPGYALDSGVVYRLEVALAVLLGAYSACSLLLLAWSGRPLQRFELPTRASPTWNPESDDRSRSAGTM